MYLKQQEIKKPVFHAVKNDSRAVWWEDKDGHIHFFDNLPENYPRFTIGTFSSLNEAMQRAQEMVLYEGWEVIETQL